MTRTFPSWKELEEFAWNDYNVSEKLVTSRGGCRCWLVQAPCFAHTDPLIEEEAESLGLSVEEPAYQPDYMKATRDLCR